MKRFYKNVAVTDDLGIALDGRAVRTPARALLILPNRAIADAVAAEWAAQGEDINPANMPITGLSNAAIDRMDANHASGLAAYAESELLCFRADTQPDLAARQAERWDPVLAWATQRYDVHFTIVAGIMHQPQPPETLTQLTAAMAACDRFTLAALTPIVTISGSYVLALALWQRELTPESAFDLAHLDELWQEELWGEDYFALQARAVRRADFLAGCHLLDLLRHDG